MSNWWDRIRTLEPARVRAVWVAVVALLVSLGVTVQTDLDSAVQALIVAVFTLLPELLRDLAEYRDMLYGIMLVALMAFRPDGILSYDVLKKLHRRRPARAVQETAKEGDR